MSILPSVTLGDKIGRYGFGGGHPFGPHRMMNFWEEAVRQGLDKRVNILSPVKATQEEIERFHEPDYVDLVKKRSITGEGYLDYGDTPAVVGIYDSAAYVVGSALDVTHRMMAGEVRRAFIPIAGLHHARTDRAGGFCVFNDSGVVIQTLKAQYDMTRIAYVDIDAHHGDGVFYAYEDDPNLFIVDTHQDGHTLYPGTGHAYETGRGAAEGTKLNIPLPPFTADDTYLPLLPRIKTFLTAARPEFIILQCGADAIDGDPITNMQLSTKSFYEMATILTQIADEMGHGRVLAVGGGGYNPRNIGTGWSSVVRAFIDNP